MAAPMDVLIVEDEMIIAMDMEALIRDSGHEVVGAVASLQEVEALPDQVSPQLALVDLHLAGGSNGFEVCAHIRERWPQALIIFLTANVSKIPEDFSGAHGVIAKPFSHAGVVNALRYLSEGVFDPPPSVPRPSSLATSEHLRERWTTCA